MERSESKPNFLIVGAQKAASTSLLNTLRKHPDIWMPDQEDPFLRDPVFDSERVDQFLDRYNSRPEKLAGLKCPDYLGRPEVPQRIARLLGRPKIILIVRNPVERAVSGYYWQMRWGSLPIADPNDGLKRLLDGEYAHINPRSSEVLDWGLYYKHLTNYLRHIPREDILVVHDKDFRAQREDVLRTVLEFLGVKRPSENLPETRSRNEGVYPLPRLRFLQIRNPLILKWSADRQYSTLFRPSNPVARGFSDVVGAFDRWILGRIYGNKRPSLTNEVEGRLVDFFADDATRFQNLVGRRFSGWPYREEESFIQKS